MVGFRRWLLGLLISPGGLFVLAALDATVFFWLPFGVDAALIFLTARHREPAWVYVLLATTGSVTGSAITFWMGRKIEEAGLNKYVPRRRLKRVTSVVKKKGIFALALLALLPPPFPFTALVLAAGALGADAARFLAALAAGRLMRFSVESILAARYGSAVLRWMDSTLVHYVVGAFIAAAAIVSAFSLMAHARRSRLRAHSETLALLVLLAGLTLQGCRSMPPKAGDTAAPRIADVQFEGFDALPADVLRELRERIPAKQGRPLTDAIEQATGTAAVEALQNDGHPYAEVGIARVDAGSAGTRLVIKANPGPLGFFGPIDITGNKRVDDRIIRTRVAYRPGDVFRRIAMERSQQQIGALELFKSVRIEARDIDKRPTDVPTLITVEEQNPWRWNLSAGYAAGERLSFEARIRNMNFAGGARRLELTGRVSRIDRLGEIAFVQPELIRPNLSLALQGRSWSVDNTAFRALSRGGQAALTWASTPNLSITFSYAATQERGHSSTSLDPLTVVQNGLLSAWSVDLDHRTMALHVEQAGGWMPGTFDYLNVIGERRLVRTISERRITLAAFGRYGAIAPLNSDSSIPILKRFFLGGSEQMRGWSRFEVSPLSSAGEPVGGRSLLALAGEVRVPILKRITGAAFAEAGNVWRQDWTVRLDDLLFDAGPGVRVVTPYGLIRLDVGFQLNRIDGLRIDGRPQRHPWRINIGLGEAF